MAAGNPVCATDLFGEQYTFWTDVLAVKFSTNLRTSPITAFSQEVADAPIEAIIDQAGLVIATYMAASGLRISKHSHLDGDAGSWS
jgi:hypothetical protein